jgi:hypothetical protein
VLAAATFFTLLAAAMSVTPLAARTSFTIQVAATSFMLSVSNFYNEDLSKAKKIYSVAKIGSIKLETKQLKQR